MSKPAIQGTPGTPQKTQGVTPENRRPPRNQTNRTRGGNNDRRGGGNNRGKGGGRGKGRRQPEKKEFFEEVLQIDRVTRVVKGGRRLRFRVTVIIGDRKGRVGLGLGKATDVIGGIQKAIAQAKKNVIRIPLVNGTIPHEIKTKYKSARLIFFPGREGTGIIAGTSVRKICDLAGVQDIVAKRLGTSNKIVNAQATMKAFQEMYKPKTNKIIKKDDKKESDKNNTDKTQNNKNNNNFFKNENKKREEKKIYEKKNYEKKNIEKKEENFKEKT